MYKKDFGGITENRCDHFRIFSNEDWITALALPPKISTQKCSFGFCDFVSTLHRGQHFCVSQSLFTMMRPLVFLATILCVLFASPVAAMEAERILAEERMLQDESAAPSGMDATEDTSVPSMSPPSMSPAPSMAEDVEGAESAMPTEEPTSGSYKAGVASVMAGAATLFAVVGYF
jgi:hypothetical protein